MYSSSHRAEIWNALLWLFVPPVGAAKRSLLNRMYKTLSHLHMAGEKINGGGRHGTRLVCQSACLALGQNLAQLLTAFLGDSVFLCPLEKRCNIILFRGLYGNLCCKEKHKYERHHWISPGWNSKYEISKLTEFIEL